MTATRSQTQRRIPCSWSGSRCSLFRSRKYGSSISKTELVLIEGKAFSLFPQFDIYLQGTHAAKIRTRFSLVVPRFSICAGDGDCDVADDVLTFDYRILKNGQEMAVISKKLLAVANTYTIDVNPGMPDALVLAMAIVLDQVAHK